MLKGGEVFVRFCALPLIALSAAYALAQETPVPAVQNGAGPNPIVTLSSEFFEHDFFNFFAYADGVYDSDAPTLQNNGQSANTGGYGWDIGGGVTGYHRLNDGDIAVSYRGDYREYDGGLFGNGTDQNLALTYSKRLTRRWNFSLSQSAGIYRYGTTYFSVQPSDTSPVETNPFSPETKYLGSGINLTYRQTRRLSYTFGGGFSLLRYNYPGAVGITGGAGSASVQYQLTPRTTLGGSYSYNYFAYQRNSGQDSAQSIGATLFHQFRSRWSVSLYGGMTRSDATGTVVVPVTLLIGQQAVGGYLIGKYNQTASFPSFSGSVSHSYHHSQFTASAGQGIAGGNGYFLASKNQYVNGMFSYGLSRRSAISLAGTYSRLTSVANHVSSRYAYTGLSASYSMSLIRYVGTNFRYDYIRYGNLTPYAATSENRLSFGITFSSKSIPLTLF